MTIRLAVLLTTVLFAMPIFAEQPVFHLSSSNVNWPPFYFKNEQNENAGMFHEFNIELFENRLGYKLQYIKKPWARAQRDVEFGETDGLITIKTEKRATFATPSDAPFFRLSFDLFTFKNHPKIAEMDKVTNVEQLKALDITMISTIGNGWHKKTIEDFGINTAIVPTDNEMVLFLARKRADGFVDIRASMTKLIKELSAEQDIVVTEGFVEPAEMYIMIGHKSEFHKNLPEINQAWQSMIDDGFIESVLAKYQNL
ncbi:substrate-binding periplasmic protein [Marinicellulosiphila megalodicopiae]|uniref:substrate-binding periplasmic protein n=1 Tax=Marinicellulosiphila megalodicopiae TaxID=2724896 RepID=UPI003BAEC194